MVYYRTLLLGLLCLLISSGSQMCKAQSNENLIISNALRYLDTPYVPHTLDNNIAEELIVNKKEVDCTTFVEYVLAESLSQSPNNTDGLTEEDFLTRIRYRYGFISGYPSRLHYTSEWIKEGVKNQFIKDITRIYSTDSMYVALSYMTEHPTFYKHLAKSPENVAAMKQIEKDVSGDLIRFLPKDKVPEQGLYWIKNGDILCFTVGIKGLDVSHMGFAYYQNNKLHLLHASYPYGKVIVDPNSVSTMLKKNRNWTGIRVLRPQL